MSISRRSFALGAAAAGLAGSARAQAPIIIKFSHVVTDAAPKGKAALRFKQLAEQYTNGRVKVEIYPNSTLYKDGEEMEALQLGAVQMLAPSTAKFAPLGVKEFEALDLPFIFPDQATYDRVIAGPVGEGLLKRLDTKGVKGLSFWDNGFYIISANKPIKLPADLKGLKIRISGSKIDDQTLRLLGANPQIMAFSELYSALDSGVVDGAQNTASNYVTQKLPEVQKFALELYHVHLQYALIANKKFWDALPADVRAPLDRAVAEATAYNNSISVKENEDALAAMKAQGKMQIAPMTAAERKVWMEAMSPVMKSAESRVGKDMILQMQRATGALTN